MFITTKDENEMTISTDDGSLVFGCSQSECRFLIDVVGSFLPSHASAKVIDNLNVILEYEDKIGNLFQMGEENYERRLDTANALLSDSIILTSKNPVVRKFDDSASESTTSAHLGEETDGVEYDYDKCYVNAVLVSKYENTFPFNFYLEESIRQELSPDENAIGESEKRRMNLSSSQMEERTEGGGGKEEETRLLPETSFHRNVAYKFEHFFGQNKGDDDVKFPHCVCSYPSSFAAIFGRTSYEQIENGTASTNVLIKGEPSTFFNPKHALYDVLRSVCFNKQTYLVGLRKVVLESSPSSSSPPPPPPESIVGKEKEKDEENSIQTSEIKKIFEAFVIDETVNRWIKEVPIEGFFCPSSVVADVLMQYKNDIRPLISKTIPMEKFLNMKVVFYKNGVSFKDYEETHPLMDTFEAFEENYLENERHVRVQLKISILVFPKDHENNSKIMCCDI